MAFGASGNEECRKGERPQIEPGLKSHMGHETLPLAQTVSPVPPRVYACLREGLDTADKSSRQK